MCSTNVSCSDFMACLVMRQETFWASRMMVNPRPCTDSLEGAGRGREEGGEGRGGKRRGREWRMCIGYTPNMCMYIHVCTKRV